MLMTKYAGSRFIDIDDVSEGPFKQTIEEVSIGNFGKPVIKFRNGLQMSVNVTNCSTLLEAFGEDSNDWIGETIELYGGTTVFKGETQKSVLVRAIPRAPGVEKEKPKPKPPKRDTFDDDIPY